MAHRRWHSDDEKALIKGHEIASVTFSPKGGERDLFFKNKVSKKRSEKRLAHGSMYVMRGATQKHYKHKIPRRPKVTRPRINLTFRQIDVTK
jgi:alkylated DNA repair dioxygenase AlkB